MQLSYELKKTKEKILAKSEDIMEPFDIDYSESCLFKGENFKIMSMMLKKIYNSVDLIYIDPPYNTKQTFTVNSDRSNTISKPRNGIVAYADTMKDYEYIEFLRERLILMRELLSEQGSIYVHIDIKMGHYLKIIMDEIFGAQNFKNDITRIKSNPKNFSRKAYGNQKDIILFYAKNTKFNIWNEIREQYDEEELLSKYNKVDANGRHYNTVPLHAPGETSDGPTGQEWRGIKPPPGRHWRTNPAELDKMDAEGLIEWSSTGNPRIKKFADLHKGKKMQDVWIFKDPQNPLYPTQKNEKMLELIIKQSSNLESIVLDCFCGSGTTMMVAQELGRKWIGIDESTVAIETFKKRLGSFVQYNYYDIT